VATTDMNSWRRGCYVVLHIRPGPPYPDPNTAPQIAADARFELSDDTWIERLDTEFAKLIQGACEPANHNIYNDVRDRHLYAFVREVREGEAVRAPGTVPKGEGIVPLLTAIALSRLVRPTSTGDRYCASILPHVSSDPAIQALQMSGACPDVFLGDTSRDWLSPDDGVELRLLMPWVSQDKKMLQRVHRAFWNHEQAMRTYYLDLRWNLIVSGFEALVNVDRKDSKAQFKRRVGKLATEFGVALSEPELDDAYAVRSKLAHGQGFLFGLHAVLPPEKHRPLYDKLESLLRAVLKKCLLDEVFGRNFADDTAVKANWP
jgi:hypothetical protein